MGERGERTNGRADRQTRRMRRESNGTNTVIPTVSLFCHLNKWLLVTSPLRHPRVPVLTHALAPLYYMEHGVASP